MRVMPLLTLLLVACSVDAPSVEPSTEGGIIVGESGAIALDRDTVPVLPSCNAGQVVARSAAGEWECIDSVADWGDLSGVPPGFTDGIDDDALGELSCSAGSVAVFDAANGWTCGSPAATGNLQSLYSETCDGTNAGGLRYAGGDSLELCDSSAFVPLQTVESDAELVARITNADGNGSGLDADTLDGLEASAFFATASPIVTGQAISVTTASKTMSVSGDSIVTDGPLDLDTGLQTFTEPTIGSNIRRTEPIGEGFVQTYSIRADSVQDWTCDALCGNGTVGLPGGSCLAAWGGNAGASSPIGCSQSVCCGAGLDIRCHCTAPFD